MINYGALKHINNEIRDLCIQQLLTPQMMIKSNSDDDLNFVIIDIDRFCVPRFMNWTGANLINNSCSRRVLSWRVLGI